MAGASPSPPRRTSFRQPGGLVDEATIHVRAGHGGRGAVSFRREPFIPHGGPDGGDGGRGGDIVLEATTEESSLNRYLARRNWRAGEGRPGAGGRKEGKSGEPVSLPVPPGTVARDAQTEEVLADLDRPGARAVIATGGIGGRGNVHFKTSTNQAPQHSEPGLPGEERDVKLELKLIAEAGLVGPPNAGKSSLLAALTAARPKIGAYPFTTLSPELGVAESGGQRLVVADIPGLIAGAASGAGLGLDFLRHVERTRALVFVVDGSAADPWADLEAVRGELKAYSPALLERPSLVAVNKLDLPETRALKASTRRPDVVFVSALSGEGLEHLLAEITRAVASAPPPERLQTAAERVLLKPARGRRRRDAPVVERTAWGWQLSGEGVERLVASTDFELQAELDRFQVQLDRLGASAALAEAGAEPGDTVRVGELEFEYQP